MKQLKKFFKYSAIIFSIILISVFIGAKHIFPYSIISPYKVPTNITAQDHNLNSIPIDINTVDNLTLKGLFIKTKFKSKATLIVVHGIGSCKEHMFPLAKELTNKAFNVFVFDGRAHGKSEGDYCTYGFYEKEDISSIVSLLLKLNPNEKIGVWGHSLGGAIAIQSLANDNRIVFGIVESTFADLSQIVYDYKKRMLHGIGIRSLSNYILENAGEIAHFNPEKVKPIIDVKNIKQPILFAHGAADERISPDYGKELFNNCTSAQKELIIVPKANHNNIRIVGGKDYLNKIFSFLNRITTH